MALRPAGRARLRVRPRTLRGRLTLVFALVTFGLAVLVGILVDVEYRSSLKSALDAGLRTRFAAIADEVTSVPAGSKTIKPAIPDVESFASGETGTFSAQGNINASFTLAQTSGGAGFINWAPRGTAANDCVAAGGPVCTETADTQPLNVNTGVTTNTFDRVSWDPNALNETAFGIHITGLTAGTYTLTLNEVKSTSLARAPLPEPGTLALMGIGIMGLFASIRRKKLV